jgi:endonuclease/exonuclease/phosphatase family metal-dependent hydrolase
MAGKFSLFTIRVCVFLNILIALIFLLASLAPYLNPVKWWFISLLGFGFVFILIILVFFIFFWFVIRPHYIFISIITLLMGWQSIDVFFAFHPSANFNQTKTEDVLRVMHWNVARFVEWRRNNNKGSQTRLKMMDLIKQQNADVLCFQEFFQSTDSIYYNNLNYVRNKLKYPYYFYSWDADGGLQWVGQAIFSKYPIVKSGMIRFPKPGQPEALVFADIVVKKDTVRFYTTHLQSVQFKKRDFESIQKIKNREDSIVENSRNIFVKLKRAIIIRSQQARMVKDIVLESPHPTVVTGDFNDVPNSYTYFTIQKGLQDAFLKKGFGIGRTYTMISPTLRIDFVLATKDMEVQQFKRVIKDYSDHYMLVTDLKLPD